MAGMIGGLAALSTGLGSSRRAERQPRSNSNANSSTPTRPQPTQESDAYYNAGEQYMERLTCVDNSNKREIKNSVLKFCL